MYVLYRLAHLCRRWGCVFCGTFVHERRPIPPDTFGSHRHECECRRTFWMIGTERLQRFFRLGDAGRSVDEAFQESV